MIRMHLRPLTTILACVGTLAFAVPSQGAILKMKANLKPANEVPPTKSNGTGEVSLTYDTSAKKLSWKGTYASLTGPAIAAHFHGPAPKGKNAGIMVPIFQAASAKSPFEGSAILTDAQAEALMHGDMYVNVHTNENKAGEIRGQVTK